MLVDHRGEWKIPELSKPASFAKQNPAHSQDKFTLTPPPGMSCHYLMGIGSSDRRGKLTYARYVKLLAKHSLPATTFLKHKGVFCYLLFTY